MGRNETSYLDNNATTPVDPRVADQMRPYFADHFANPSSDHPAGRRAKAAVDRAAELLGELIGAASGDIVWTSGATESNNLAIKGVCEAYRDRGDHIITSRTEHRAVLDICEYLEAIGLRVTYLEPDATGRVAPAQVAEAIEDRTVLVTVMLANNEIGTLQPLAEIGRICKQRGVLLHTDAAQAVGKVRVNVEQLGADLASISAHKMYGPKGAGALYVRRRGPRVRPAAQIHGGGHQRGLRSGTLNVPGIVGLGAAAEIIASELADEQRRLTALRDRLYAGITAHVDDVRRNGHATKTLPNTLSLSFARIDAEALIGRLGGVAVSSASACSSTSEGPSHVLRAIGTPPEWINGTLRFSVGRFNTPDEIDRVVERLAGAVADLRELSAL
ncbi:MAG: cysteine desulfurase [Phycisphaerae bacterium]|nr:cysteine desulfurase [Phycisphaerae bacterium]